MPLTEEVKQRIASEKMPRLSDAGDEPAYTVDKKAALEKGLRAELRLESGEVLAITQLNPRGQ